MSDTLLETIQTLQHQAERLEQEAADLRHALARVAETLLSPTSVVARYVIEGETYDITQAEVEAVKSELTKTWAESALYELAAVKKVAKKLSEQSTQAQSQHFLKTVEAIRAQALANGSAIETEAEAVVDD